MLSRMWKLGVCSALLGLFVPVQPQTTFGTIRGRVVDASDAAVPGAAVTVTNTSTGIAKPAASDSSGTYEVGYLQPGAYSVAAEKPGFRRFLARDILLSANAVVLVEVHLEVGELSSSVTISSPTPVINTESAQLSDMKTQRQYLDTPLNTRGYWDSFLFTFMSTVAGAQPTDTEYTQSFAGTRNNASNFTVDGISTNSVLFSVVMGPANPSMDMVKEVDVHLSGNSAEFGSPGQATIITKGGENRIHGSAFWYYNTAGLNARAFFSPRKAFAVLNDYGFSFSGPVFKNRTFYSGAFEAFNYRTAATPNLNLASLAVRKGDFSKVRDASGRPVTIKDPASGAQFAGNIIPPSRLNATALKIQDRFFPAPNFGDPESVVGNYRDSIKQGQRKEQVDVRVDHQISVKNSFFGRFDAMRAPNAPLEGSLPTIGFRIQRRETRNFLLSDTHVFRPNLINEFRFGLTRNYNPRQGPVNGPAIVKELGLTNLAPDLPSVNALPQVSISGFQGISQIAYNTPAEMNFQWQDNLSLIHGRHTLKMGPDIARHYGASFTISPQNAYGNILFTGSYAGYSYADFLLGIPNTASRAVSGFLRDHSTNTDYALFVQDDIKVSSRLSLTLGLRYEINPPYREKENRRASFDPWTGRLVVPSDAAKAQISSAFLAGKLVPIVVTGEAGWPARLASTDRNNFAPRIGWAYKLTSDNRTVVRGAFGVFYTPYRSGLWSGLGGGPYTGSAATPPNTIVNGAPLWQLPQMFPAAVNLSGAANLQGIDPHLRDPYLEQWNFTLEREIRGVGLRASYMGTKSMKLPVSRNVNQVRPSTTPFSVSRRPFPQLGTVLYTENSGTQIYNGLVLSAEQRFRHSLQFQASYTWAKNLTDARIVDDTSDGTGYLENAYDRRAEWGNDDYTRRHRFVFSSILELPFGTGHRLASQGFLSHVAGGWSLSTFAIAQTGRYFTPNFSGSDPSNTGNSSGRPDRIADGNLPGANISRWFDRAAFVVPPPNAGRFGNSGVNILRGPGTALLNAGLFKRCRITESLRLRLEGTFTNVLNHPNFGLPNRTITSAAAGIVTSTASQETSGPRTTRVGLRLDW